MSYVQPVILSGNMQTATPKDHRVALTIVSGISLFSTVSCIVVFVILMAYNSHRVNIPLIKITLSIQSVHAVALVTTLLLNDIDIKTELLCSALRYVLYCCYLTSIFLCCAITIHLWLVITRRKLNQTRRNERWYYIISFTLAISLSAALATIPNAAYRIPNRCLVAIIPSREYLGIRWGLYYSWFIIASAISILCMLSVLSSARKLTHTTHIRGRTHQTSTEAYRNAVNARANSKRLRSLVFYTIAYPLISFICNFPQLILELLSTVLEKELDALRLVSLLLLYSEGLFLGLAFFFYPAVLHSIRDINNSAVQYWVIEQEEFWRLQKNERKRAQGGHVLGDEPSVSMMDQRDIRQFTSWKGRFYHWVLKKTPEGKRSSIL